MRWTWTSTPMPAFLPSAGDLGAMVVEGTEDEGGEVGLC